MRGEYSRVGAKIQDHKPTSPSTSTVPFYLRTTATISSWLSLAGYTLFALIFTSRSDNVKLSRIAVVSLASFLLTAGYLGAAGTFFLSRHAPSVQYNAVLLPFLFTSVSGLIEIVINHSTHKTFPVGKTSPYIYAPLIVASLTTIFFGLLSFLAYWHIRKQPQPLQSAEVSTPAWQLHAFAQRHDPEQSTELLPTQTVYPQRNPYARYEATNGVLRDMDMNDMIPEDEAQRRQLLRLLLAREQPDRGPSPDASSTYRIDLPDDYNTPVRPAHTRHLSVPDISRPRAGSAPSITDRWHISNLLGRKRPPSQETNEVAGDLPDAREVRRREIERNSLMGSRDTLGLGLHSSASELDITGRGARYSR